MKKELKNQLNIKASEFISGDISALDFVNFITNDSKSFKYLKKYIHDYTHFLLPEKEKIIECATNYTKRVYLYDAISSYLNSNEVIYKMNFEYKREIDTRLQLPRWFEANYMELKEILPNIDELIKTKTLKKEITKLCKKTVKYYPDWIYNSLWPIANNRPMVFNGQSNKEDKSILYPTLIDYYFEDELTHETRVITQREKKLFR